MLRRIGPKLELCEIRWPAKRAWKERIVMKKEGVVRLELDIWPHLLQVIEVCLVPPRKIQNCMEQAGVVMVQAGHVSSVFVEVCVYVSPDAGLKCVAYALPRAAAELFEAVAENEIAVGHRRWVAAAMAKVRAIDKADHAESGAEIDGTEAVEEVGVAN
jgi:hypothetical protein